MTNDKTTHSGPREVCRALLGAADVLFSNKARSGCTVNLPPTGTCWVSGDLHDNVKHLQTIVKLACLDTPSNHLVLQELIHSGDESVDPDLSYQTLVKVAELVLAYPNQVHPILANHELSQAMEKPITKGCGDLVHKFIQGVHSVFDTKSGMVLKAINAFIFSMPLVVRSQSGLMCTHSLPDEDKMILFDENIINREVLVSDIDEVFGSANLVVWGRDHTKKQIKELGSRWGVKLFCVGHALVQDGIEVTFPNMLSINSDHSNGAVLPINLEKIETANKTITSAIMLSSGLKIKQ
jgi:hypothetical protein